MEVIIKPLRTGPAAGVPRGWPQNVLGLLQPSTRVRRYEYIDTDIDFLDSSRCNVLDSRRWWTCGPAWWRAAPARSRQPAPTTAASRRRTRRGPLCLLRLKLPAAPASGGDPFLFLLPFPCLVLYGPACSNSSAVLVPYL